MMAKVRGASSNSAEKPRRRRSIDPEAREMQMAALAMDLVEQRLRDGTASSQETTHFLKLVSSKAILENNQLILKGRSLTPEEAIDLTELAEIQEE